MRKCDPADRVTKRAFGFLSHITGRVQISLRGPKNLVRRLDEGFQFPFELSAKLLKSCELRSHRRQIWLWLFLALALAVEIDECGHPQIVLHQNNLVLIVNFELLRQLLDEFWRIDCRRFSSAVLKFTGFLFFEGVKTAGLYEFI